MPRRRKQARRKKTRRSYLVFGVAFFIIFVMLSLLVGIQTVMALMHDLPKLNEDNFSSISQTSKIYAADGTLLAEIYGDENRTVVPLNAIPSYLKEATIAIEDERFYEHGGVDYQAIGRALVTDISQGRLAEGGSTITQQLVKKVYVTDERSFTRKIVEAVLATQLERTASKDTILERYLNTIYYGENAYGVEAAAQTYFGKSVTQLDLAQCALLAGLPQAPSAFSPKQDMAAALERRNTVLQKMADLGYVKQAEAHYAATQPIVLNATAGGIHEPYFVEYVKQQLIDKYGAKKVFEGGLTVQTTIEPALQAAGVEAIKNTLNEEGDPAAALVSIDPATGYIKAMVSSQDFKQYQFNLAVQARRQPGSCFKPFVLTAAVEQGANPQKTYYMSKQIDIPLPGGGPPWHVTTYDNKYYGASSLETGMLHSDNTVYAQLVMDVGPDKARDAAERLGIKSPMATNPSIALGGLGQGVSPLEMSSAYATLSANGMYSEPIAITKVEMADGTVDYQANPQPRRVVKDGVAYEVTKVLEQDIQRGTSSKANIGRPAAGKTGSTENLQDAWFVGYTPDLSTAVWIGFPDQQLPMDNVHGGQVWGGGFPATIWKDFMTSALQDKPKKDFALPKEKPEFKQLKGSFVLYSGGDSPTTRDDGYGNEGRTTAGASGDSGNGNNGNGGGGNGGGNNQ
ncbi:MAG: PBP1A family penicillin-binding protein [Actinobacteria bacterium]|nr:PBP1A family penicillin-binding protein [Actinomycetota bacterium]MCL5883136.1 PBP1A family penicillin-binding protein [Actinomycetota bacterium]